MFAIFLVIGLCRATAAPKDDVVVQEDDEEVMHSAGDGSPLAMMKEEQLIMPKQVEKKDVPFDKIESGGGSNKLKTKQESVMASEEKDKTILDREKAMFEEDESVEAEGSQEMRKTVSKSGKKDSKKCNKKDKAAAKSSKDNKHNDSGKRSKDYGSGEERKKGSKKDNGRGDEHKHSKNSKKGGSSKEKSGKNKKK